MKREIKKLQRIRDAFKCNLNNGDIKDKDKLLDGIKRIETVLLFFNAKEMEWFRKHEREYKQKEYGNSTLHSRGRPRRFHGDDSQDEEDSNEFNEEEEEEDEGYGEEDCKSDDGSAEEHHEKQKNSQTIESAKEFIS